MEHPENSSEYKGLTVNDGVAQPSIVNPYLNRARFKRRELSVSDMVEGIVKGNVTDKPFIRKCVTRLPTIPKPAVGIEPYLAAVGQCEMNDD